MEVHIIEEIWKDIVGYEGSYQVSNLGRIKSLDRYIKRGNVIQFKKGKILTPVENKDLYHSLKLSKNGKSKTYRVHRIVAEHFCKKPDNYENIKYEVNHKDFNRGNNVYTNLEFITHSKNIEYSCINGRYNNRNFFGKNNPNYNNHKLSNFYKENPNVAKEKLSRPKENNGRSVKIELYDTKMNYINTFDWIGGCAEYLRENNYTKATINSIRNNITIAIKNNKKYLNHYFKYIA